MAQNHTGFKVHGEHTNVIIFCDQTGDLIEKQSGFCEKTKTMSNAR
jgi:hypothetical protein